MYQCLNILNCSLCCVLVPLNCSDVQESVADVLKVIKSVYGNRKQLEKSLKIAVGSSQDRVSIN